MKRHLNAVVALLYCTMLLACAEETDLSNMNEPGMDSLTYLALGDSYTIGESVEISERYPVQINSLINEDTNQVKPMADPKIIATTGWTTDELQRGIEDAGIEGNTYDFVSLLIGVNNQYRGYPIEQYIREFEELLTTALAFAAMDSNRVVVISIPDYGVTPFGRRGDEEKIARELDEYNRIAQDIARTNGVDFLNITPISREAAENPALIAKDQLHPSGQQYKRWVDELIYPWFLEKIAR